MEDEKIDDIERIRIAEDRELIEQLELRDLPVPGTREEMLNSLTNAIQNNSKQYIYLSEEMFHLIS